MEEEEISYKTLRKIQEMEKNSPVLNVLKPNFYIELNKYLKNLENRCGSESSQQKQVLLKEELSNIEKIAINIYEQREKKIVLAAITKVRGGNPDISKMIDIEKHLYDSVLNLMQNSRKEFLKEKSKETAEPIISKKNEENTHEEKKQDTSKEVSNLEEDNRNPIVRITENIPEFIGTDEKKYNLRNNDVLSMPEDMSEMLVKRGVAKKVNHNY
jgi:DNA replication initiation complex subunit (GINS family)